MKSSKENQQTSLLKGSLFVALLVAIFVVGAQWNRLNSLTPQPTLVTNDSGKDFVFGRVVNKNPNEFIKVDAVTKKSIFDNSSISFAFSPSKFDVSTFELKDAPSGSGIKMEQIIIQSKTGDYSLDIQLKLDGIGGACPDFPNGYSLSILNLSGQNVTKAKFVDKSQENDNWPVGKIYLVMKNESSWYCPNVAGLESPKNGSAWIVYNLEKMPLNSSEYKKAEQSLDEVVSSIHGFW